MKVLTPLFLCIFFHTPNLSIAQTILPKPMTDAPNHKLLPHSIETWNQNLGQNVIIYDVGASTNTTAYQVIINRNGKVLFYFSKKYSNETLQPIELQLEASKIDKLFNDFENFWPLPANHPKNVAKSRSFGHYSYLTFNGVHSDDLDTYSKESKLSEVIQAINALVNGCKEESFN